MTDTKQILEFIDDRIICIKNDLHYRPTDEMVRHWRGELVSLEWVKKLIHDHENRDET